MQKIDEKMEQGAIYVRVSTEDQAQKGFSIKSQIMDLEKYAIENSINVIFVFKDEGVSGTKYETRKALQHMLLEAEKGTFKKLLIYSYSRLGRDNYETEGLVRRLIALGIEIISLKEKYGQDPLGVMIRQIIGAINQYERAQIVERLTNVMENKAKLGHTQNRAPLGYKFVNKAIIVDDLMKPVVNSLFESRAAGVPYRELAIKANMSAAGVMKLLKNQFYIGKIMFKKQSFKGHHEPIITEELFNSVNNAKAVHS